MRRTSWGVWVVESARRVVEGATRAAVVLAARRVPEPRFACDRLLGPRVMPPLLGPARMSPPLLLPASPTTPGGR